jgi:hypothetical protein
MVDDATGQESHDQESIAGDKTKGSSQRELQAVGEAQDVVVEVQEERYLSGLAPVNVPDSVAVAAGYHLAAEKKGSMRIHQRQIGSLELGVVSGSEVCSHLRTCSRCFLKPLCSEQGFMAYLLFPTMPAANSYYDAY